MRAGLSCNVGSENESMKKLFLLLLFSLYFKQYCLGQNDMHNMHHESDTTKAANNSMEMPNMSHAYSMNLPMTRNGSGTGWLPDASVMYGRFRS